LGKLVIIFPEGNVEHWVWLSAKVVEVSEEELKDYPIPGKEGEFYTEKLDIDNALTFGQYEFLEACKLMGITDKELFSA
jgi:hypothetical protein